MNNKKEEVWKGEYKNFKEYQGKGIKLDRNGDVEFEGEWREGVIWEGSGSIFNENNQQIWKGSFKNGKKYSGTETTFQKDYTHSNMEWKEGKIWCGKGTFDWIDKENNVWHCEGRTTKINLQFLNYNKKKIGEIKNGSPQGKVKMFCDKKQETYKGLFSNGLRSGRGILIEDHTEFFVDYNEKGILNEKKRTFEGIRIMIGKHFIFILIIEKVFYTNQSWVKKNFSLNFILKCLFVSRENVGKTSFKVRLKGSTNDKDNTEAYQSVQKVKKEEEMTHGVDISKWHNPESSSLLSIWGILI